MNLLLDSSGIYLVAGLADDERGVMAATTRPAGSPESRDLQAVVDELLDGAGRPLIAGVIAGVGPGTFIGTRMAVSFANGLAAATGCALRGISSLAALAAIQPPGTAVVRDARQGQVYLLLGDDEQDQPELVDLSGLTEQLQQAGIRRAVLERARVGDPKAAWRLEEIAAVLSRAVEVEYTDRVPLEGIWLAGRDLAPQVYIEPEYCKGYT